MKLLVWRGDTDRANLTVTAGAELQVRATLWRNVPVGFTEGQAAGFLKEPGVEIWSDGDQFDQGKPVVIKLHRDPIYSVMSVPLIREISRWHPASDTLVMAQSDQGYLESLTGCTCVNGMESTQGRLAFEYDFSRPGALHASTVSMLAMAHQQYSFLALQSTALLDGHDTTDSVIDEAAIKALRNGRATDQQLQRCRDIAASGIARIAEVETRGIPQGMVDEYIKRGAILEQFLATGEIDALVPLIQEAGNIQDERKQASLLPKAYGEKALNPSNDWLLCYDEMTGGFARELAQSLNGNVEFSPWDDSLLDAHNKAVNSRFVIGFAYAPTTAAAISATGGPGFLFVPDHEAEAQIWHAQFGRFPGINFATIDAAMSAGTALVADDFMHLQRQLAA